MAENNGRVYQPKTFKEMDMNELEAHLFEQTGFRYEGMENGEGKLRVRVSVYGRIYNLPTQSPPIHKERALQEAVAFIQNNVNGLATLCRLDSYEEIHRPESNGLQIS